jgi:hypothetical protein
MIWESWDGLGSWEILGTGRSWDLEGPKIWRILGWRDGGPEVSIYTTPDHPPTAAVMLVRKRGGAAPDTAKNGRNKRAIIGKLDPLLLFERLRVAARLSGSGKKKIACPRQPQ